MVACAKFERQDSRRNNVVYRIDGLMNGNGSMKDITGSWQMPCHTQLGQWMIRADDVQHSDRMREPRRIHI